MRKFIARMLLGLMVVWAMQLPAHAVKPTRCQQQWLLGEGFDKVCFQEEQIYGLVEIVYLDMDKPYNPWATFIRFHRYTVNGEVETTAQTPATASRQGRLKPSYGQLSRFGYSAVDSNIRGFVMRQLLHVSLQNGKVLHDPSIAVALHHPLGDGRDNPTTFRGNMEDYEAPKNPDPAHNGTVTCFRGVDFRPLAEEIYATQEIGRVMWLVRNGI